MTARNETLDRLLQHMAWANADLFKRLGDLPDTALSHTAPGSEWSVGAIAHHLVTAAENYAQPSLPLTQSFAALPNCPERRR